MDWIEEQNRIPVLGSYDVLVVGGGVAEVAAAGAAARSVAHAAHRNRSLRTATIGLIDIICRQCDGMDKGDTAQENCCFVDPPRL